jgi:hypothetical protein
MAPGLVSQSQHVGKKENPSSQRGCIQACAGSVRSYARPPTLGFSRVRAGDQLTLQLPVAALLDPFRMNADAAGLATP